MPDAVAKIARKYDGLSFYFMPGMSTELYRHVAEESVDVAIIVEPRFVLGKSLKWKTVREEPLVLIVPADLPDVDPHDLLRSQPFIRYDRTQWGGRQVDNYLKQVGIRPEEWMELDALDAIAALVSRGLGVALVPDWAPPWQSDLNIRKIHYRRTRSSEICASSRKAPPRAPNSFVFSPKRSWRKQTSRRNTIFCADCRRKISGVTMLFSLGATRQDTSDYSTRRQRTRCLLLAPAVLDPL